MVQDTDGDGMPDSYEDLHACLDKSVPDDAGDPDGDGLLSGDEYDRGTNPCSIDTDAGGETDGSEFAFGANPFDYATTRSSLPRSPASWTGLRTNSPTCHFSRPGRTWSGSPWNADITG